MHDEELTALPLLSETWRSNLRALAALAFAATAYANADKAAELIVDQLVSPVKIPALQLKP